MADIGVYNFGKSILYFLKLRSMSAESKNRALKYMEYDPEKDVYGIVLKAIEIAAVVPDLSEVYQKLVFDKETYANWYEARHKKEIEIAFLKRLKNDGHITLNNI